MSFTQYHHHSHSDWPLQPAARLGRAVACTHWRGSSPCGDALHRRTLQRRQIHVCGNVLSLLRDDKMLSLRILFCVSLFEMDKRFNTSCSLSSRIRSSQNHTHVLVHSLTHPLTHSLTHSLTAIKEAVSISSVSTHRCKTTGCVCRKKMNSQVFKCAWWCMACAGCRVCQSVRDYIDGACMDGVGWCMDGD